MSGLDKPKERLIGNGLNGHMPTANSSASLAAFADGGGADQVDGARHRHGQAGMSRSNFEQFACDESGMHGMPIIGSPRNSPLRRAIWLLLVLTSAGILTFMIQDRVQKYLRYETTTNVLLKYEQNLSFPAVTFCNFNPFYQSLVNDTKDIAILSLIRSNLVDSSVRELGQATARTIPRVDFQAMRAGAGQGAGQPGGPPANQRNRRAAGPGSGPTAAAATTRKPATTTASTQTTPGQPARTTQSTLSTTKKQAATSASARTSPAQAAGTTKSIQSTTKNRATATTDAQTTATRKSSMKATGAATAAASPMVTTGTRAGQGRATAQSRSVAAVTGQTQGTVPARGPGGSGVTGATTSGRGGGGGTAMPVVGVTQATQGGGGGAGAQSGPSAELLAVLQNETALEALLESVTVGEYTLQNGVQIERMLVSCTFRGAECNVSDFQHVFTTYGNCYTFNPDESRQVSQAGQGHGLEVILNIEESEYIHGVDQSVGARVLLHSSAESPHTTVDSLGFAAAPGETTLVGISRKLVTTLGSPYNEKGCRESTGSGKLKHFDQYTLSNCALECFAELSESICGCRAPYMPSDSNSTVCNPIQMFRCIDEVKTAIVQGTNSTFDCATSQNCVQPCEYSSYGYVLSSAQYPSSQSVISPELSPREEQELLNFKRKNYVHLSLYYEELNYERVDQEKAYDWLSLVSEIGGLAGILLGASALTILEFVDFALTSFGKAACQSTRRQQYDARRQKSFQGTVEMTTNWTMESKDP